MRIVSEDRSGGVIRLGEKRAVVAALESGQIRRGCQVMGISPSSYYYRLDSESIGSESYSDGDLVTAIESIVLEFDRYGYRRVTRALHRQRMVVNHKRVLRVMREKGLLCKRKRRFTVTTDSCHGFPIYPNLVRNLPVTGLDLVWVADITYIGVRRGFVYLAAILDKYSKESDRLRHRPKP